MSQNITLWGASYSGVPSVTLPKTGGGTASFTDVSDTTATASSVLSGSYFYTSAGSRTQGSVAFATYYVSSSSPSSSQGSNGDIWLKTV